jgi:hypothetical protein
MFMEPGTEEYVRRRRNRIWFLLVIGWFVFSILLLTLLPKTGGLIASVLLIGISIARAVIFRRLECSPKLVRGQLQKPDA